MEVEDHPRSRGVYSLAMARLPPVEGSSPLARGLRGPGGRRGADARIIPARAGFTAPRSSSWPSAGDHPRSRGVYTTPVRGQSCGLGSSPLARGLPARPGQLQPRVGIIPARAGFTTGSSSALTTTRDHPRSRGVYSPARASRFVRSGSSPLARGLHRYPHGDESRAGSSPLARGLRPPSDGLWIGHGIIPARAGFT